MVGERRQSRNQHGEIFGESILSGNGIDRGIGIYSSSHMYILSIIEFSPIAIHPISLPLYTSCYKCYWALKNGNFSVFLLLYLLIISCKFYKFFIVILFFIVFDFFASKFFPLSKKC